MKLDGKATIVFGGASGLGAATSRLLVERGARVLLADLNEDAGEALAADLGPAAEFAAADVTVPESVQASVGAAAEMAPGGLRLCVNCAGIATIGKVAGSRGPGELDAFGRTISVNLTGAFNVLRLAAAAMLENDPDEGGERGVCVNTASVAAFDGQIGQIAYSASKGGVAAMTLPAARDLGGYDIRVNTIAPGVFDTPMVGGLPEEARQSLIDQIPSPHRLGKPEEYAALVCHIAENGMLNGEVIRLDGAVRMAAR